MKYTRLLPLIASAALTASLVGATSCDDASTAGTEGGNATACGTDTPTAIGACVEQSRYEEDLRFVAQVRDPGSAHHQAVRDLCESRFKEYGFTVEQQDYGTGVNVIGVKQGATDTRILLSAHYDHIPDCAGADDNATGVAGLLESARVLSQAEYDKTLVVACWDEEELGLVGAENYAVRAQMNSEPIEAVFVYEMLGYSTSEPNTQRLPLGFDVIWVEDAKDVADNESRGDFIAAIGDESISGALGLMDTYAETYGVRLISLEVAAALKNDPNFGDLRRSDHAPFWEADIPALFISDTSEFRYDAYHCRNGMEDVVENLDHAFATGVVRVSTAAVADTLGVK